MTEQELDWCASALLEQIKANPKRDWTLLKEGLREIELQAEERVRKQTAIEACKMMRDFWLQEGGHLAINPAATVTSQWIKEFRHHFNLTDADFQTERDGDA